MNKALSPEQDRLLRQYGLAVAFDGPNDDRPIPDVELIGDLLSVRFTISDIAKITGFTRQHISKIWADNKNRRTPKEVAEENWPIPTIEFRDSYVERRLRDHLHYVVNRANIQGWKARVLTGFYRHLLNEGLAVEYDPTIGPTETNSVGGYAYVPRMADDGLRIMRENRYIQLTPEGRRLWIIPKRLPDGSER